LVPDLANEQHYEVPADFFAQVMGDHLKYSCCYWPTNVSNLSEAEAAALELSVERAGIEDGMQRALSKYICDLGFQFRYATRIHSQAGERPVDPEHRRHCLRYE
jgi:hypothetical protein